MTWLGSLPSGQSQAGELGIPHYPQAGRAVVDNTLQTETLGFYHWPAGWLL